MENLKHSNFRNRSQIVLMILLVISMVVFGFLLKDYTNDGRDCQANPFVWGAKEVSSKTRYGNVSCSCMVVAPGNIRTFTFNQESMSANEKYINYQNPDSWNDPEHRLKYALQVNPLR